MQEGYSDAFKARLEQLTSEVKEASQRVEFTEKEEDQANAASIEANAELGRADYDLERAIYDLESAYAAYMKACIHHDRILQESSGKRCELAQSEENHDEARQELQARVEALSDLKEVQRINLLEAERLRALPV